MNGWLETLLHADLNAATPPITVLLSLALAFLLGQVAGWVYLWTHTSPSYSRSFVSSLVVMPVIVAVMMIMVAGSVALAFGLLAVFAVVRFRNVLKDTRDTTYILWVIVEGMSVGTGRFTTALLGSMSVALVLLYLRVSDFGSRLRFDAVLSVEIVGDLSDGIERLKAVLQRHTIDAVLSNQQRMTDIGSTYSYRLALRDPTRGDELRQEIVSTEDLNLISLYFSGDESEM